MQLKDKATMNTDEFGMPSGHAQYSGFTLVYVLLVSHSLWAWSSVMFGAIWVCGQRVISTDHSILQVAVGLFIGSVLAIIAYKLTMWFLKFKYPQMVLPKSWPFGSILYF
jgi:membrane-associated phospholipid phosphatase